ncbi:BolA domain UV induced protein Uvi31 [Coemansia spiralis]|uniref:BolA domain UV induced protein Uvi31 n=2 Tax=Coemansia TaxID=4863 RepID=A0A9W8KXB7_9FUNG|nr:BolA domain UV induced protein Uvi31 [Coemansia umbellata]KAJ2624991.1 BolA domain UV induced protein Uvi31 [Coemansia sp. RSA 1358]KAJ2674814.1 BolA domain UV induced protein Uvi31 [Coemansia spiralis]
MSKPKVGGPLEQKIRRLIEENYSPLVLEIENDSHKHRHHAPMQGVESTETHFRIKVVSADFVGLTQIKRHRNIYALLKEDMEREGGIHALALVTKTPKEVGMEESESDGDKTSL